MSPTTTHDGGSTSPLEDRLRDALQTEATAVDDSPAVWDAIRTTAATVPVPLDEARRAPGGGDRPGRGRLALLAVAACVAAALVVAGIVVARRDDTRDVYVGPATTVGTGPTPTGGAGTVVTGPITSPTSDLGRALWATAALRAALEDEQLATVAARYGLRPDAELRLVDARATTDATVAAFTEAALPRLGDGDTERNARQLVDARLRQLAVVRQAVGDPGPPSPTAPNRVGGDTTTILGQYDQTVEAVAVVGRIIAKQGGGRGGTLGPSDALTRTIRAAQLTEVPGARAQWLSSTSAALAARAAEDQPGPVGADVERDLQMRRDQAVHPDPASGWPGVDDQTRAILQATVTDDVLPAETEIVDRLAAGQAPGGSATAGRLLDQAQARLAELHRYEQALIGHL